MTDRVNPPFVTPGDILNPWRGKTPEDVQNGACGFYPPEVVGRMSGLTHGQKRLFERLVRFAGRNGRCFPSEDTLAEELGISDRQIRRELDVLQAGCLIRRAVVGRGRGQSTRTNYRIVAHRELADAYNRAHGTPEPSYDRTFWTVQPDKLSARKARYDRTSAPLRPDIGDTYDRTSVTLTTGHFPPQTNGNAELNKGDTPPNQVQGISVQKSSSSSPADLAAERMKMKPVELEEASEGVHAALGLSKPPSPAELAEILEPFPTFEEFLAWFRDFTEAGRHKKIFSYSGAATDARRHAPEFPLHRPLMADLYEKAEAARLIPLDRAYDDTPDSRYRTAMDQVQQRRVEWIRKESGRDAMPSAELDEWKKQAAAALPRCKKCDSRGRIDGDDWQHPEPCDCHWATMYGWRKEEVA